MSKGKQLLDDFLDKANRCYVLMMEKRVITLDELRPTWEARERLEAYLDPPRDEKGHWLPQQLPQTDSQERGTQEC